MLWFSHTKMITHIHTDMHESSIFSMSISSTMTIPMVFIQGQDTWIFFSSVGSDVMETLHQVSVQSVYLGWSFLMERVCQKLLDSSILILSCEEYTLFLYSSMGLPKTYFTHHLSSQKLMALSRIQTGSISM